MPERKIMSTVAAGVAVAAVLVSSLIIPAAVNTGGTGSVASAATMADRIPDAIWKARTDDPEGLTGPEELLAAAHASCFSMALSNTLAKAGFTAEQLDVTATVTAMRSMVTGTVMMIGTASALKILFYFF